MSICTRRIRGLISFHVEINMGTGRVVQGHGGRRTRPDPAGENSNGRTHMYTHEEPSGNLFHEFFSWRWRGFRFHPAGFISYRLVLSSSNKSLLFDSSGWNRLSELQEVAGIQQESSVGCLGSFQTTYYILHLCSNNNDRIMRTAERESGDRVNQSYLPLNDETTSGGYI